MFYDKLGLVVSSSMATTMLFLTISAAHQGEAIIAAIAAFFLAAMCLAVHTFWMEIDDAE